MLYDIYLTADVRRFSGFAEGFTHPALDVVVRLQTDFPSNERLEAPSAADNSDLA
jgi:hypothetical protein